MVSKYSTIHNSPYFLSIQKMCLDLAFKIRNIHLDFINEVKDILTVSIMRIKMLS